MNPFLLILCIIILILYVIKSAKLRAVKKKLLKSDADLKRVSDYYTELVERRKSNITPDDPQPVDVLDFDKVQQRKIDSKYLYPIKVNDGSSIFHNKKIVITGNFYSFKNRNDLAKLFWEAGADVDVGVGKNTDYLILGDNYGPVKLQKAMDLGVEVIDEKFLYEHFKVK